MMMREVKGNAWQLFKDYNALCITTNGFIKANGDAVMGAGIAKEARSYFPGIEKTLGGLMLKHGNRVMKLGEVNGEKLILSFPVKHNWFEEADIYLIKESCKQLVEFADKFKLSSVLIPRPGCGNGKLKWVDVKPQIEPLLDDRFHIVSW
jgi:hypothetical protein